MFAATQQQQHSMYNSSPYHWDHQPQLRVSSHESVTVSSHPNDSHWYTDSVLCQSQSAFSSQQIKTEPHHSSSPSSSNSSSNSSSPMSNTKSLLNTSTSSHLLFSPSSTSVLPHSATTGPRAVIPSKRAAQNRAAQRAFRQRKERYVKDLEKKAKLMDEWKLELDQLRQQNKDLKENTIRLEKQIHLQQYGENNNKLISPMTSPILMTANTEILPPPVVVVMDHLPATPTKTTRRKIKQAVQLEQPLNKNTFMPINLRAPDQTGFIGSPTTSCSSQSSINGLDEQSYSGLSAWHNGPSSGNFENYDADLDFMNQPHQPSNQVLDDLCVVLSIRSRPDISSSDHMQQQPYVMSLNRPNSLPTNSSNMLVSRPY